MIIFLLNLTAYHQTVSLGIPGSKLDCPIQNALPEHLCIHSIWLGEKTQVTPPETDASGTEAGVDQNEESIHHSFH